MPRNGIFNHSAKESRITVRNPTSRGRRAYHSIVPVDWLSEENRTGCDNCLKVENAPIFQGEEIGLGVALVDKKDTVGSIFQQMPLCKNIIRLEQSVQCSNSRSLCL